MAQKYSMQNYEISNYAKIGSESKHNLAYWRYHDYIGIGPGAHGRITEDSILYATERYKNPKIWLKTVQKQGHALSHKEALTSLDKAREMILMGLRLKEGIDTKSFKLRCGIELIEAIDLEVLNALIDENYICWDHRRLKTTLTGKIRLNAILEAILK